MIEENSIETCILPYVKWIASPGWMHETGRSGLVLWDDPEGWDEDSITHPGQILGFHISSRVWAAGWWHKARRE